MQLQLMQANSEISNLHSEIKIINLEKDSLANLHDQKADELDKAKQESLSRLEEIREMRKSETACYQYQVKVKNLE